MHVAQDQTLMTLREAAATLPHRRGGRPTHSATLFRWATEGLRGIKLEVVQVGATKCTSREALARFFARLTEVARPPVPRDPSDPSSTETRRA